ncbi:MAG: hydrogenase nickel incorporation protein HypB [Firmicutes bacterium]|nr:hydrogenase nickel incorporation protein HypB [Bacillota bacterium]
MEINISRDLFDHEAELAVANRKLFQKMGIIVLNLLAGPGAGKTSMIRSTAPLLKQPVAVIEGDPASSIDTDLLNSLGIPAVQINTEGGCHLEAPMVSKALDEFKLEPNTLLIIENVGNLICTAGFPLGESIRVVMVGVSEGDDKPYKYPDIFQGADAVILNKIDLQPYVDFNRERFQEGVRTLRPGLPIFEVSCRTGRGLSEWSQWLERTIISLLKEG